MRLPASPMPFSSNNRSISGSPVMDGSFAVQQISNQNPNSQQRQSQQHHGPSSVTSMPASRIGQVQFPNANRFPASFNQDPSYYSQLQKKPRLDIKQEDRLPPQALQQFVQRQDPSHLQYPNTQLQAFIQQKILREQQQFLQSLSPIQRAQLLEKHQLQLRNQFHQQGLQPSSAGKRPNDSGVVCSRRLMQYLYHQRQRPQDNSIAYWRKFVAEYYSPSAKERWCLSHYNNVGYQSAGVFPQATLDPWHCDICGSKHGRGFEATFEVLPRLNEIKFGSGVMDELLFLDLPRESRLPSGKIMLEYAKAVQESVYEQVRVVHEGKLRIIFETNLKISSWEFCAHRHEELLPRRLVAPQVNHLLQIVQKCQSSIPENGSNEVSHQELQANCNMVVTAGCQLARNLESQSLNDLGFSKRYVRALQISEVVNSTKDLMNFCMDQKVGPIEGLKAFTRHITASKQNMQNVSRVGGNPSSQTDLGGFNTPMSQHPGFNTPISNNEYMDNKDGLNGGSAKASFAATNYQNMVGRSSMNSNHSSLTQEASPSVNSSNSNQSTTVQKGPGGGLVPVTLQTSPGNGNALIQQNSPQSADSSQQALHTQMIQHPSQEMADNGGNGWPQQYPTGQNTNGIISTDGTGFQSDTPAASTSTPNTAADCAGATEPSRNNSLKTNSNCESSVSCLNSSGGFNQRSAESSQGFPEELVSDITDEFTGNGFLTGDIDDYINFDWNA